MTLSRTLVLTTVLTTAAIGPVVVRSLVIPSQELISGQTDFLLHCRRPRTGQPVRSPLLQWTFNGTHIHPLIVKGSQVLKNGSLLLKETLSQHTGEYACFEQGLTAQRPTTETRLVVRERTVPTKDPEDVVLLENSGNVHLHCKFTYDYALHDSLEVRWTFYNGNETRVITSSDAVEVVSYQGRAIFLQYPYRKVSTSFQTLTIRNISLQDDGWYTCEAKTRLDNAKTKPARIDVKKRSEVLKDPEAATGVLGGRGTLSCTLSIDSTLVNESDIYWTKNGRGTDKARTALKIIRKGRSPGAGLQHTCADSQ